MNEAMLTALRQRVEELSERVSRTATKDELRGTEETLRSLVNSRYSALKDKVDRHVAADKAEERGGKGEEMKLWVQKTVVDEVKSRDLQMQRSNKELKESIEIIENKCRQLATENATIVNSVKEVEATIKRQMDEIDARFNKEITDLAEKHKLGLNVLANKSSASKDSDFSERISSLETDCRNYLSTQAEIKVQLRETCEGTATLKEAILNKLQELSSQLEECSCKIPPKAEELTIETARARKKPRDNFQLAVSSKKLARPPRAKHEDVPLLGFGRESSVEQGKSDDENLKSGRKLFSLSNSCENSSDVFCEPSEHDFGNTEEDKEFLQFIRESIKDNGSVNGILGDVVEAISPPKDIVDFVHSPNDKKPAELKELREAEGVEKSESGESFYSTHNASQKEIST
eukprot:TRINITY_DN12141_c0_g1_i3.p1 TRINITY_DN12141_c0_g1~~TRINITY_DN12141_c0_g1_i3.p1  ORF type:complete len:404 (-),score=95.56 TRINITY_DN12141_c0_g1_i3:122-1333(-)